MKIKVEWKVTECCDIEITPEQYRKLKKENPDRIHFAIALENEFGGEHYYETNGLKKINILKK